MNIGRLLRCSVVVMALAVVVGVVDGVAQQKILTKPVKSPQKVVVSKPKLQNGYVNGHEYVDLGLPSGLKWATCNVGATNPEDYGDYFAWGETTTKSDYSTSTSTTYGKNMGDISGNSRYDTARANWGGTWRLPTKAEIDELVNNCTWTWTTQNGVNGYKVIGKNGNSIFLPAAGYRSGSSFNRAGSRGNYWSSTPSGSDAGYACSLLFNSGNYSRTYGDYCINGRSVRPVTE